MLKTLNTQTTTYVHEDNTITVCSDKYDNNPHYKSPIIFSNVLKRMQK